MQSVVKMAASKHVAELRANEERERGHAHLLGGHVGPTPHGGTTHAPAVPS